MFWHWLASRVEHTVDVEGLKERTGYRQFQKWRAYRRLEPFGDDWDQAAMIAAAAMNPHVKRQRKLSDFKPRAPQPRQTPQQIQALLAASFGVKRGND